MQFDHLFLFLHLLDDNMIDGATDGMWQLFETDDAGRPLRPIRDLHDAMYSMGQG